MELVMKDVSLEIDELTRPNLKKRFCIAIYRFAVPESKVLPYIPDHLRYMAKIEGHIFLSGSIIDEITGRFSEGMTIFHTSDRSRVSQLLADEPLIQRKLRKFELKTWEVSQGTPIVSARLTSHQFELV
jgi:uncharacterized protein